MLKHMGLMASTGAEGGLCDQQIALRAGQRHQRTRRQRKRTSTLNNASCFLFSEHEKDQSFARFSHPDLFNLFQF